MAAIRAGTYRHRVTIEREGMTIDPETGYREPGFYALLVDEPAGWLPGPGREYLAGEAVRGTVEGRIELRYHPGTAAITNADRVLFDGAVYLIKAPPLLDETRRRTVTLMVAMEATGV